MAFAGGLILLHFKNLPGSAGPTPNQWPSDAGIGLDAEGYTFLMFAHPRCPCTRASIGELNRLLARVGDKLQTKVFFYKPSGSSDDWAHTGSWIEADAIPGVSVHLDNEGNEARRFGAETSGFVVLFNSHGQLLFKGGITAGRSHAGDNAGASAIVSLLLGEKSALNETPVYGCSLVEFCENKP